MIKIESLKNYAKVLNEKDFTKLTKQIYEFTNFISENYPNYKKWYYHEHIPRIFTSQGEILFVRQEDQNKIIAMCCLKRDKDEKKICTLYVKEEYRNNHIGAKLLEKSLEFLGTTKPLITFPDCKLHMFQPFIDKYGWELTEIIPKQHDNNIKELCFNGKLTNNK